MELSLLLLKKITIMLVVILMGFCSVKAGSVKSEQSTVLSKLCFDWVCPASLINSFIVAGSVSVLNVFLLDCGVTFVMVVLAIVLSLALKKPLKLNDAEQGSLIFTNSASMALPLAAVLLGAESVIFCAPHMGIQNFFIFTLLPVLMGGGAQGNWRKILLNRNLVAIAIGFILFFFQIPLPELVRDTISMVGGAMGVFCMLMIGMLMGGVDFGKLLRNKKIYLVCFLRLIFYPLIGIVLIVVSGITRRFPESETAMLVLVMCMASPVAALVTQMADLYCTHEEAQDAGSINVFSTILSILTMPLMVLVYQMLSGLF